MLITGAIRTEIERLLLQWFRAKGELSRGGPSSSPLASVLGQQIRSPRSGNIVPVLYGEKERADRALAAMEKYQAELLVEAHLDATLNGMHKGFRTREAKAKARGTTRMTYYRWVTDAECAFWRHYTATRGDDAPQAISPAELVTPPRFAKRGKRRRTLSVSKP